MTIKEYDLLVSYLETIIEDNIYCEDDKLYIKSKLKYDVFNLVNEIDSKFIKKLCKKLEYKEGVE